MNELAGVYVHVPFCSAVCPYCDFAVRTGDETAHQRYVEALIAEIEAWHGRWDVPCDTVYFGGGTPSALHPAHLGTILDALRAALPFAGNPRIFFEANPEDVTDRAVGAWRALGIGFVSLGIQSFDDDELRFLGRRHSGAQARRAVERCLAAGFDTVSADVIFGLPERAGHALEANLAALLSLAPPHVSCYQLTVHEGTTFHRWRARGKLHELDEDVQADQFALIRDRLGEAGWQAYEVSNFARGAAHRSAHNQKYWRHVPYLGLGPSAHSFDGRSRWWNVRNLDEYSERVTTDLPAIEGTEVLGREQLALEALMLGLRTAEGLDLSEFADRYGVHIEHTDGDLIDRYEQQEVLRRDGTRIALTSAGLAVADGLIARFTLSQ